MQDRAKEHRKQNYKADLIKQKEARRRVARLMNNKK